MRTSNPSTGIPPAQQDCTCPTADVITSVLLLVLFLALRKSDPSEPNAGFCCSLQHARGWPAGSGKHPKVWALQ